MPKTNPPDTLGIRHVALRTADLARAERFYTQVLGYGVWWRPDAKSVYLTRGGDNLALHEGAASAQGPLDHFGIMLKRASDVDAWAEHLRAHGLAIVEPPKTHRDGARSFYTKDPDGVLIQFIHQPPTPDRA